MINLENNKPSTTSKIDERWALKYNVNEERNERIQK